MNRYHANHRRTFQADITPRHMTGTLIDKTMPGMVASYVYWPGTGTVRIRDRRERINVTEAKMAILAHYQSGHYKRKEALRPRGKPWTPETAPKPPVRPAPRIERAVG